MITCTNTADAIAHFEAAGEGAKVVLTGTYKNDRGVRNYFYRKDCKVSIEELPDGTRLITFNGKNKTGRAVSNKEKQKYGQSHRLSHEPSISEVMLRGDRRLEVGESIVAKGHKVKIKAWLRKTYPEWDTLVSKDGDAWTIRRTK
jgi:hypothetical protein